MLANESAGISTAIQPGPTATPVPQLIPIQCEVALDPDETNDSRPRLDGRAEDGIQARGYSPLVTMGAIP